MKTRIRRTVLVLLLLALLPTILVTTAVSLPKIYQESYYAELVPMTDYLRQAEGKRLILVGGSSVAFGTDTQLLEQLLREKGYDYTVCPYGFYAAIGTSAMLALSEHELRAGDIVLLMPEPVSEAMSTYFGATAFLKSAEGRPELMTRLNAGQRTAAIGNLLPYLQEKYSVVQSGRLPEAEGVYARSSFNECCNLVYVREGNQMTLGYDTSSPIVLNELVIEEKFIEQVNAYCRSAEEKGARVFMSFSPMNRSALTDGTEENLLAFFNLYNNTFNCTIISDPHNYIMDSGWFYDSNFHLNSAGAVVRTCQLAQDLLAELGCYEPIDYVLPEMPASSAKATVWQEDSGDFLFSSTDDEQAWTVSGLTEQGLAKAELSIPSSYDGKPVIHIASDALQKADSLEELRIPESIASLPDMLFAGCAALRRLVLTHTSAPCSITAHTLDGAEQVQILVPYDAYPMYRDGYGCEANPWTAYTDRIYTY